MGAVYKASDPALERVVAIKTIHTALLADDLRDEFLERFRREARAAGRLSHPNIVSVFDLGFDEATGTPFIVMEYVAGVSLEAVLAENPVLPIVQAIEIMDQVGSALEEAHRHGIVHRDVKPANIFLDDRGRVKVGDFGVASSVLKASGAPALGGVEQGFLALDIEPSPLEELHHHEGRAVRKGPHVEDWNGVLALEPRGDAHFTPEALGDLLARKLVRADELDRDLDIEVEVERGANGPHRSGAEHAAEHVPVRNDPAHRHRRVRHFRDR